MISLEAIAVLGLIGLSGRRGRKCYHSAAHSNDASAAPIPRTSKRFFLDPWFASSLALAWPITYFLLTFALILNFCCTSIFYCEFQL